MSTPELCAEWARSGLNCREFTDVVRANGERAELLAALHSIVHESLSGAPYAADRIRGLANDAIAKAEGRSEEP